MLKQLRNVALGLTITTTLTRVALASVPAAAMDPAAGTSGGRPVGGSTHGWEFAPNTDLLVTHLGLYDHVEAFETTPLGLREPQWVALFDTDENLLTLAMLRAGTVDELLDHFRYAPISPFRLQAGKSYVVAAGGATGALETSNRMWSDFSTPPTFAPELTYVRARFDTHDGRVYPYPRDYRATEHYRFGPNFRFVAVPESGTLAGVLLAVAVLAMRRPALR